MAVKISEALYAIPIPVGKSREIDNLTRHLADAYHKAVGLKESCRQDVDGQGISLPREVTNVRSSQE